MTFHRKSTSEGIGGTVKRLIDRRNLQTVSSGHSTILIEMYNYAKENITNIHNHFIIFQMKKFLSTFFTNIS